MGPFWYNKEIHDTPPYCVEIGHIFPYELDKDLRETLYRVALDILDIVGLKNTFVHLEFKYEKGRIKIIEINPRLGGGMITELMFNAQGLNPAKLMTQANLNLPLSIDHSNNQCSAIAFITRDKVTTVTGIDVKFDRSIINKTENYPLPRRINGLKSGEDRLGYIILKPNDFNTIKAQMEKLLSGNMFTFKEREIHNE